MFVRIVVERVGRAGHRLNREPGAMPRLPGPPGRSAVWICTRAQAGSHEIATLTTRFGHAHRREAVVRARQTGVRVVDLDGADRPWDPEVEPFRVASVHRFQRGRHEPGWSPPAPASPGVPATTRREIRRRPRGRDGAGAPGRRVAAGVGRPHHLGQSSVVDGVGRLDRDPPRIARLRLDRGSHVEPVDLAARDVEVEPARQTVQGMRAQGLGERRLELAPRKS